MTKYYYVNRWYDDEGVPHYHGIITTWPTLKEAQANVRFNMLAVSVDLVYGPCTEQEMFEYMGDVLANPPSDELGDMGTFWWLE